MADQRIRELERAARHDPAAAERLRVEATRQTGRVERHALVLLGAVRRDKTRTIHLTAPCWLDWTARDAAAARDEERWRWAVNVACNRVLSAAPGLRDLGADNAGRWVPGSRLTGDDPEFTPCRLCERVDDEWHWPWQVAWGREVGVPHPQPHDGVEVALRQTELELARHGVWRAWTGLPCTHVGCFEDATRELTGRFGGRFCETHYARGLREQLRAEA